MAAIKYVINKDTSKQTRGYQWSDLDPTLAVVSNNSDINNSKDLQAIVGSINNLFRFNRGERLIQPEYGTMIRSLLYTSMSSVMDRGVDLITAELTQWEPRIRVTNVSIVPSEEYENTINITIEYYVPSLPNLNKQSIQLEIS